MNRLFFFGYAPAGKVAWPLAGLGEELEPLDARHGVFTNLVTTPILSALCYLPADRGRQVLEDVRANVLPAGAGGGRRLNVLTGRMDLGPADVDCQVRQLFWWPSSGLGAQAQRAAGGEEAGQEVVGERFRPGEDVGLVFNFWAVMALFSFLIQGRERCTRAGLAEFGRELLTAVVRGVPGAFPRPSWKRGSIRTLPDSDLARLGLCFRVCVQVEWDKIAAVLTPFIQEQRRAWQEQLPQKTRDAEISPAELAWVLSVLRSLVPLPHTEIYDRYHPQSNPIGKWQDCFMSCQAPGDLVKDGGRPLFWQFVGEAVAAMLLA